MQSSSKLNTVATTAFVSTGKPLTALRLYWIVILSLLSGQQSIASEPWLLVDTHNDTLTVMNQSGPLDIFHNIALGVRGAGIKQHRGDEITPLGSFLVSWLNPESQYHFFIGLNYPNLDYANRAYREGRIDLQTLSDIRIAHARGRRPPQSTPLGGYIGIHGIGAGDPFIHANINWTNGCVAVTNEQIRRLVTWVKVGTKVEIR